MCVCVREREREREREVIKLCKHSKWGWERRRRFAGLQFGSIWTPVFGGVRESWFGDSVKLIRLREYSPVV